MAPISKRRSTRQAASRKRSVYLEPDTDEEIPYANEDDFDSGQGSQSAQGASPRKRRKITRRPETRSRSTTTKTKARPTTRKKVVVIAKPRKERGESTRQQVESRKFRGPSRGVIPAWASLPAAILRDVFLFASQPLTAENITWLCGAARTCRAFAEPALEALYYAPAFWSPRHPHGLLELLRKPDARFINYRTKIKRIEIDVKALAYTAYGKPPFDLCELISELPQLQHLEIVHPMNEPPYRDVKLQNWSYPADLFQTLNTNQIRLKAWRWTREMLKGRAPDELYTFMASVHDSKAFENVEELIICGFNLNDSPPVTVQGEDGQVESFDLAWSLSKLKNLKDVTFISCNIVRETFLSKLPTNLERLELSNCHEVNSEVLAHYLIKSGAHLRELVLDHNPAIDLAFLPDLKANCPRLEVLEMDLHYYSEYHAVNDAEPLFDELLQADEFPTWPSTMRQIDLVHLQKCNADGAVNLFRSLVDGAKHLPDLRFIVLHSHINVPWRDRAGFRDYWIDRLQRVYKREDNPPNPHNGSKLQYSLWKESRLEPRVEVVVPRVKAEPSPAVSSMRRSQRVAASQASLSATSACGDSDSGDASDADEDESPLFVQGLCEVVDIRIDNQRPRENQFTERDFLDSEASGDEDWNEDADIDPDEGYAW